VRGAGVPAHRIAAARQIDEVDEAVALEVRRDHHAGIVPALLGRRDPRVVVPDADPQSIRLVQAARAHPPPEPDPEGRDAAGAIGADMAHVRDAVGRQLLDAHAHAASLLPRAGPRFARLAKRFAALAPAPGVAGPPLGRARAEVDPEGAGEAGGGREAVIERDREHALIRVVDQRDRGALEPLSLDEGRQCLAGDRPEDAVEVERREQGDPRQALEREILRQVIPDVVDHPVDPLLVLEAVRARPHRRPGGAGYRRPCCSTCFQ